MTPEANVRRASGHTVGRTARCYDVVQHGRARALDHYDVIHGFNWTGARCVAQSRRACGPMGAAYKHAICELRLPPSPGSAEGAR